MSGVKKNIFNGAFLLLVLLITLYSVFHGENLSELLIYLKQGDFRYWLLGASWNKPQINDWTDT